MIQTDGKLPSHYIAEVKENDFCMRQDKLEEATLVINVHFLSITKQLIANDSPAHDASYHLYYSPIVHLISAASEGI